MDSSNPPFAPPQPISPKNQLPLMYFVIGMIVVILVAVVSFGAGKRVASPVETNAPVSVTPSTVPLSPTPDPTAKWKTYKNEKLKIEFIYPNDWYLKDRNGELPVFLEDSPFPSRPPDGIGGGFHAIEIDLNICPEGRGAQCHESLEDRKTRIIKLFDPQGLTEKKVHISSKLGLHLSGLYGQGMLEGNYFRETSVDYLNTILVFTLYRKQHETIYDQILSTFTFIDQAATPTSSPSTSIQYVAPASWQRYTTQTGLALCLPPKWESNPFGTLVYNRDSGYKPTISTIEQIPYDGGSRREAYFQFWEKEYPNVQQLVSVSEELVNGNSVLTIVPANANEPKTSPEGLAVVWFAAGKLWKAGLSSWGQINTSQTAFLKDFYTLISCSL